VARSSVQRESSAQISPADERFRALFEEGFDYIWNTLRRLGIPPCDLEDVTHDVLLDVYRKIELYDPVRPLRPWLFAFAFRVASDFRRRAQRRRESIGEIEHVDGAPLADERLASRQDRLLVAAALEKLDLDQRAVFVLHDLDDVAVPEIARTLGVPLNTAYSRLRAARENFVKALRRLQREESRR